MVVVELVPPDDAVVVVAAPAFVVVVEAFVVVVVVEGFAVVVVDPFAVVPGFDDPGAALVPGAGGAVVAVAFVGVPLLQAPAARPSVRIAAVRMARRR